MTREHILRSAIEVLRDRGYAGLSISGVCDRADVAPTSIYWHFGSKAGLMEAVIGRIGMRAEHIQESVKEASSDPLERLDQLLAVLRTLVTTQPFGSLTGVALLSEGCHASPELRATLKSARRRELDLAASEFQAELGTNASNAEVLATLVMACTNYAAMIYRSEQDESEVDRILKALREAILLVASQTLGEQAN